METQKTHHLKVLIVILLVFLSCRSAENRYKDENFKDLNTVNTDDHSFSESTKSGVNYRNPRAYDIKHSVELLPDPSKIDRSKDLKLWVPIPREWDSQKAVKIISVEPAPHGRYYDPEYGNSMLFWDFGKEPERPSYKVNIRYRLEQYKAYIDIDPNRIGPYDRRSKDYILYTRSTPTITITNKVKEIAKIAIGNERNPYLQAKRILKFVQSKMLYIDRRRERGSSISSILDFPVIDERTGEEYYEGRCHEYSNLFVAICRAIGIPARTVTALEIRPPRRRLSGGHGWAEIYLPDYGWIPIDVQRNLFGDLENDNFVILSKGRDIQIGPKAPEEESEGYGMHHVLLSKGRADRLGIGVRHLSNIQRSQLDIVHYPDPFPADALAEYRAKLYPKAEAEKYLPLYRKRVLRWIYENTRECSDKVAVLLQAYEKLPKAKHEHQAFIFYMLHKLVGDKKFSDIGNTYTDLRVKSGEPVSTAQFQKIAEDIYGKPLDWFFNQWVGYIELPELQLDGVTFSEDERGWHVHGNISQLNKSLFRLPVELAIRTDTTTEHETLWSEDRNTDFEFHTANKPIDVLIDPNNDILQIRKMPPLLENPVYDEIVSFITNGSGQRPLHYAARTGRTDIASFLIAEGANVNAIDILRKTPLHTAASYGHEEVAKLFIAKGTNVNSRDVSGQTALHYAARNGDKEIVELLLENGADVNIVEREYNRTAARFAMKNNHSEVVELLVSKGADISPLHMALYMKDEARARRLIESGADVNKWIPYGTTPLHRAVSAGFKDIVELLIAKGANVNAKDNWNWTPLHSAVEKGYQDLVELLISKSANINVRDGNGRTPLWYAQDEGHTEIIELLRKHGAKE